MSRRIVPALLALFLFAASPAIGAEAAAKPFVSPLFTAHMVLQRNQHDPVWGWTKPGAKVTVSIEGKTATATAGADGKWLAKIGPLSAGGPYELTISGPETVKLADVLVGDVWICSGQSNMEFGIGNGKNAKQEIANANYPQIRLFTVVKNRSTQPLAVFGKRKSAMPGWQPCTPKSVAFGGWNGFTAVGYFFGRDLYRHLKVPIGLIHTSWGGTVAEAWTSAAALETMPDFKSAVEKLQSQKPGRKADGNPNVPTVLYNAMIAPLVPFAIKGVIWYQGESNVGRAKQYATLLAKMIGDWRNRFEEGNFPFLIVQLANFMNTKPEPSESGWAELREAQSLAAEAAGHSAIASAIDIGEAHDIHPKNKQEVGRRLALVARALAYGEHVEYEGPTFKSLSVQGDKATVHFDHLGGGLEAKGGPLKGFAIAGADGKFVWGDATIDGKTVVVSSPKVEHPVSVRYAWADNPVANLYNKAGLPANPFRASEKK